MDSEPDRLGAWRDRLRRECEEAMPALRIVGPPANPDVDPCEALTRALELARRHAITARYCGAEVIVRAVGIDSHGYAWATFHLGGQARTLCTSDDAATLAGLAEMVGT